MVLMVGMKRNVASILYICHRIAIKVAPEISIQYTFVILSLFKIGTAETIPLLKPLKEYLPVFCCSCPMSMKHLQSVLYFTERKVLMIRSPCLTIATEAEVPCMNVCSS